MNKSSYFLGALAFAAFLYFYPASNTPTQEKEVERSYAAIKPDIKAKIVDNYILTKPDGDKELILDSTYTYTLAVRNNTEKILLEGTWELSYKGEEQHIILNSKSTVGLPKDYAFVERKFALTEEGLKDVLLKEVLTRQNIKDRSLAAY